MKKLNLIFLSLNILLITLCSCIENKGNDNKTTHTLESIIISQNAGEFENVIALLTDSVSKNPTNNTNVNLNKYDDFTVSKSIVGQSGLFYLEEYIISNCNSVYPSESELEDAYDFYFVKIIRDAEVHNCYYYTKNIDTVINYFEGMRSWLQNFEDRSEFKQLLEFIDKHIQSLRKKKELRELSKKNK